MERNQLLRGSTILGFLLLSLGIITAYRTPATGYELSTYAGTPTLFWACSCLALVVSILVVFSTPDRGSRIGGAFLGGLSMTAIVSLPVIRGYHYLGENDSLSHLGTTHDMNAGLLAMTESRYPVVHTLSSVLHDVTGLSLNHVMLIVVTVFIIAFFVFVPLVVRELTGSTEMAAIGLFSGLLLLPINHLSPSIYIHPTTQALMYTPVVLFAFFVVYRNRTWRSSSLFLLVAPIFVLLHPQQAANLLVFFVIVAAVQAAYDVYRGRHTARWGQWVLPEVSVYVAVFILWVRNLPAFWSSLETVYMIPFAETQAAESTVTRGVSLTAVGGSLPEVFMKLFFVSLVFLMLTFALLLYISQKYRELSTRAEAVSSDGGTARIDLLYVFCGLAGIGIVFLVYLIGGISDQYFRQLGMVMVFGTILGAIALGYLKQELQFRGESDTASVARLTIAGVLLVCLLLSLPVVFSSPYIYYSSDHVTEAQMEGYETTFEHQSDTIAFDDVRSSTSRYGHAILGRDIPSEAYYNTDDPGIPDHFADRALPEYFDEPTYVPVTETDRVRDPVLWRGFRFSNEDFAYLDEDPQINRVQTNGGYDLYLVESR